MSSICPSSLKPSDTESGSGGRPRSIVTTLGWKRRNCTSAVSRSLAVTDSKRSSDHLICFCSARSSSTISSGGASPLLMQRLRERGFGFGVRVEQRQQHLHHGALAGLAVDLDLAAEFADVLQAFVAADAHAAFLGAVERPEQPRLNELVRHAHPGITHLHRHLPRLARHRYPHLAALGGGVQRVVHQMAQHALQAFLVAAGGQARPSAAPAVRGRGCAAMSCRRRTIGSSSTPAAEPGGVAPSRSCSISRFILSSELCTVNSMSCWNSGLACRRSAFFNISDSWVTMFLRSCTTKADMRLKASNLRSSSSASVACICARKPAACRLAVFTRSRVSQFIWIGVRGRASTTKPSSSSCMLSGHQQPEVRPGPQPGRQRQRAVALGRVAVFVDVDDPARAAQVLRQGAVGRLALGHRGQVPARRLHDSAVPAALRVHRLPPGLSSMSARPRTTRPPTSCVAVGDDSMFVKRSHCSR